MTTLSRLHPLAAAATALLLSACGGEDGGVNNTVAGVSTASAGTPRDGEDLIITLEGRNLDKPIDATPSGNPFTGFACRTITLSTTAPFISTSSTAYYRCTQPRVGANSVVFVRPSDGVLLATVSFTGPEAVAAVTTASAATPRYSQDLIITLDGRNLGLPITATAGGTVAAPSCRTLVLNTTAPFISTPTRAFYRCTQPALGDGRATFARTGDGVLLTTVNFTVPVPQVTLTVSNGAGVSGDIVITLEAARAPITVNNFLSYVASGFYTDTAFHRLVPGFILQGGGYARPLVANSTPLPALKPTSAAITLEDNAGLSNVRGTVAMARTGDPDSATSQFFFNLVDNPFLDRTPTQRGYAVFGSVTAGTDLVTAITAAPCVAWPAFFAGDDPRACLPSPNVVVTAAVQTR